MSLLADLLSKNKTDSSHGTGKHSPVVDIPPTLFKTQGTPAKIRTFNYRYIIVAVLAVAFIAVGLFLTAKLELLGSSAKKKSPLTSQPQPLQQTTPPQTASVIVTPPLEQTPAARISLEEPPPTVPPKKSSRTPKAISMPHPAQKIVRPQQLQAPLPSHPKAAAPLKIDTALRDSLLYAARSAEQTGDWRSALSSYRKAQKIDPENYAIMSNVAAALNNLGLFDDGVQEAERALVRKPNYVPALINAAIGYSSKGNTQKALRLFTFASAIDPSNRSLVINLGILHERAGNLDDAQATYRQLAEAGDPLALQGMGRTHERKGNRSEAIRAYRQIMALPNAGSALKKDVKGKLARLEE